MATAKITPAPLTRDLSEIAADIRNDYAARNQRVYYAARPYVEAMAHLRGLHGRYGADPADRVVRYALSNLETWRGPVAQRVKAELKAALADFDTSGR